jgi:hypothetical protein
MNIDLFDIVNVWLVRDATFLTLEEAQAFVLSSRDPCNAYHAISSGTIFKPKDGVVVAVDYAPKELLEIAESAASNAKTITDAENIVAKSLFPYSETKKIVFIYADCRV